jgi:uncharacterized membrane protein
LVEDLTAQVAGGASYVDAYRKMREGALYLIIASLLVGVGSIAVMTSGFFIEQAFFVAMASLIAVVVLIIVGGVIGLMGLRGRFVPGTRRLAELNPKFGTSSTLIYVGLFWGLILMIIGALLLLVLIGAFIMIAATILMILGYVGLIVLMFKLYDVEKSGLYLAAGVLFIIGIFISIASFIAWILLYVALGESIRKAEAMPPTPTAPAPVTPS